MTPSQPSTPLHRPATPLHKPATLRKLPPAACWQTYVSSGALDNEGKMRRMRVDSATPQPPLPRLSTWSADVGWHKTVENVQPANLTQQPQYSPQPALPSAADPLDDIAELVAEIAHDIRTPIAVAKQIVSTVADQARHSGQLSRTDLDLLDVASTRLLEANKWAEGILIGQCMQQGNPVNICRRFYPAQWRVMAQPLLAAVAAQRKVQLCWVGWDRSLPRLYLDENQLTRALMNLITNAVQASPVGGEVAIRVAVQNGVTQQLIIAVEDTGPGMQPRLLKQFNADPSDTPENLISAGLGLRTAKNLILGCGGEVRANHTGSGTLVRVSLPTDYPASLLRGWLTKNLLGSDANDRPQSVQLFAIRVQESDPEFSDSQLQQAAGERDFVYRVSKNRWLWFSLNSSEDCTAARCPSLDQVMQRLQALYSGKSQASQCNAHRVYSIRGGLPYSQMPRQSSAARLTEITHLLATQIERLMAGQIPAVDDIGKQDGAILFRSQHGDETRQIRQDMPQAAQRAPSWIRSRKPRPNTPSQPVDKITPRRKSQPVGEMTTHAGHAPPQPSQQRHNAPQPAMSVSSPTVQPQSIAPLASQEQPAARNSALSPIQELASQWRLDQDALQASHSRLLSGGSLQRQAQPQPPT